MAEVKANEKIDEKLVKNDVLSNLSFEALSRQARELTKKRIRREKIPRIREHKYHGYIYYQFYQGPSVKEIYLGTAKSIFRAVKG